MIFFGMEDKEKEDKDDNGILEKEQNQINDKNIKDNYKEKNEIIITLKISKDDIGKKIYFLDNTNYIDDITGKKFFHNNLSELNPSNTDLFIDNKQYEYQKYFNPDQVKIYTIKLRFKINIKDCHCMFAFCHNIIKIDFSSFISKDINNMSNMFEDSYLTDIDLSSFNTKNVTNMNKLFYDCHRLKTINLSSFNTENVIDMNYIFSVCSNLKEID